MSEEVSGQASTAPKPIRRRLSQADVPSVDVREALRIPVALRDQCGSQPTAPLLVAKAIKMQPSSGPFRMLTGAASAYGLTDGASKGATIGLTALGKRVVSPTAEGADTLALRDAVMKPRVVREFLTKYNNAQLPSQVIALNVLEDMGVPREATERALDIIKADAEAVGYLQDLDGHFYVHLGGPVPSPDRSIPEDLYDDEGEKEVGGEDHGTGEGRSPTEPVKNLASNRRVFITHGKNRDVVDQLKDVLTYGGFDAVVSVEGEATAKPVPDKVMDDMRSCAAGIVHVGAERTLLDAEGNEHKVLNPNVLIEIGAALALYKRNFILLVETGVDLPSNLQGLYEVRYEGGKLDYEATMKLLRAFNDFKGS